MISESSHGALVCHGVVLPLSFGRPSPAHVMISCLAIVSFLYLLIGSKSTLDVLWPAWDGIQHPWEYDFMRELFPPPFQHVNNAQTPDVVICSHSNHVATITDIAKRHTIGIIVHLSDEAMGTNRNTLACSQIYHLGKIVLRQYAFHGDGKRHANLIQIPLGYMKDLFTANATNASSTLHAEWSLSTGYSERNLNWSFVGGLHGKGKIDRQTALSTFANWKPNYVNESISPHEMKAIYDKSLFVIVGRGWHTLDCFRIYEAIISGAIPIVVGPKQETDFIFAFNGSPPPLIFTDLWERALVMAQTMTPAQTDARRLQLVRWYQHQIDALHTQIHAAVGLPAIRSASSAPATSDNQTVVGHFRRLRGFAPVN